MITAWSREGDSHTKGVGMLVVSLRGVNFGFWSHLGSSGQNAIIFSRKLKISFRVAREEILKFFFFQFVLSKGWATPRLVSFGGLIQNVRRAFPPLSYWSPPGSMANNYKRYLCEKNLKKLSSRAILISFEFHSLLSFAWTLTRPTN